MLTFQQKRELQRLIVEQNKILANAPSFTAKRTAQKAKLEAMEKLGMVKQPSSIELAEITASAENSDIPSNGDQTITGEQEEIVLPDNSNSISKSPLATKEEYHYKEADSAYSHSSRYGAQAARERFVDSINDQYDRLNKDLNDEQKKYLDESFVQLKNDYLEKEKPVLSARSGMVSAHIAGGSKFNSKLATRGQGAYDKALGDHAKWFSESISSIEQGIDDRRDGDQIAADAKKAEDRNYIRTIASFAAIIGAMNDPGNEKALFMNSAKRNWAAVRALGDDKAFKVIEQINKALSKESLSIDNVIGKRSNLWKEINQFLIDYESSSNTALDSLFAAMFEPENPPI
jgi:hypothetical protein